MGKSPTTKHPQPDFVNERPTILRGEITFDPPPASLAGAVVHICLEKTSLANAAADYLAEITLQTLPHRASSIPFEMPCPTPDPRERYELSVHVDFSGDGAITKGDYINKESCPVLTRGCPGEASVSVKPV